MVLLNRALTLGVFVLAMSAAGMAVIERGVIIREAII